MSTRVDWLDPYLSGMPPPKREWLHKEVRQGRYQHIQKERCSEGRHVGDRDWREWRVETFGIGRRKLVTEAVTCSRAGPQRQRQVTWKEGSRVREMGVEQGRKTEKRG